MIKKESLFPEQVPGTFNRLENHQVSGTFAKKRDCLISGSPFLMKQKSLAFPTGRLVNG
jgi:hypothetical protein